MARPEIHNQLISGTPLSERELYARYLDLNGQMINVVRGMAASRKDSRWLHLARIHDGIADEVKKLIDKGGPRIVWMPDRH